MPYSTLVSNLPIMDLKKEKKKQNNSNIALYTVNTIIVAFKSMECSFLLPVCFEDILQDQQNKQ